MMSREERLNYHDVPGNLTPASRPMSSACARPTPSSSSTRSGTTAIPAILKGYFDRIFLPGVSFVLVGGDGSSDKGTLVPNMKNIKKVAYVTTYGGDRLRTMIMGDPPRRLARRWAWVTFGTPAAARLPRALRHEQRDARAARRVHRQGEAAALGLVAARTRPRCRPCSGAALRLEAQRLPSTADLELPRVALEDEARPRRVP